MTMAHDQYPPAELEGMAALITDIDFYANWRDIDTIAMFLFSDKEFQATSPYTPQWEKGNEQIP
jgi:hypothetical protein